MGTHAEHYDNTMHVLTDTFSRHELLAIISAIMQKGQLAEIIYRNRTVDQLNVIVRKKVGYDPDQRLLDLQGTFARADQVVG